ncbi:SusC/RagA family TonB-linked outer membrane protein [Hymenobacter perfusus]|uniref:SusC/RagA family TonB-linked outer membrane protein n=1 Tax=Hymenobacter perfusus TaxID=1236770 RepID=A0A3R9MI70_9BACT|nr:SusC/RagA family TonB-linked outer membrane protein [Hymenobacter perfusus]RSK46397.1 SusC/RagA family TonB-linked outer membrane protein [Hymenobacter perfusus]
MNQLYALGLLLPLSIPALAQQPDTVRLPEVAVQDSVLRIVHSCPTAQVIQVIGYRILPFLPLQEQLRQIAGLQATPYSGAPGAQVAVRLRGAASLSGNAQPLYVVDGVPVFQHTFRGEDRDGQLIDVVPAERQELDVNPLLSIPSEDIASVEVLKGAYETALYGSQGINGVIKITTKRGTVGKPRLRYAGYGGVQQARTRYELLDARQYADLRNEAALRFGQPAPFSPAQLAALGRGTDWQDELVRTAAVQEHHLSLGGGTATTRYYAAADYLNQQGVVLTSRLRRYAARAALNQQIGQHLHLDATGSFSQTEQRVPAHYALSNAVLAAPTLRPTDTPTGYEVNPLDQVQQDYQTPQQQRLLAQLGARYELTTGLTLDVRGNLERATLRSRSYRLGFVGFPSGESGTLTATYRQLVLHPALRYARSFDGERHAVTASLEAQYQKQESTTEQRRYVPGQPDFAGFSRSASLAQRNFYQLTAGYTFAERYQVQATVRHDANSVFTTDDRWSWLPGAQVRWHAAKENFWTSAPGMLDVWVGWGRTSGAGNGARNFFQLPVAGPGGPGSQIDVFVPELTRQVDAGIEAGLFNGHLTVTAQAYARRTARTLYLLGLPATTDPTVQNYVRNTGLELTLQSSWQAGQLQGTSRLAAAANRNRFEEADRTLGYFFPYHRSPDGQSISTFYGLRAQGLDATGTPRYEDVNSDGRINMEDQQPLGSGLPRQLLSFSQQLTLDRFEAQLQADGMFGYQMNNTVLRLLDAPNGRTNASRRVLDRWTPTNTGTDVPAAGTQLPLSSSSTLQSGNHVRLSALTLSYKVWEKEARSVQVWLGGQNLLVLSGYRGYDPNVSSAGSDNQQAGLDVGAYPVARTFLVGVRATL